MGIVTEKKKTLHYAVTCGATVEKKNLRLLDEREQVRMK